MHQPLPKPALFRVPPLIKRNTALIALSQSFAGAGMPLAYGIGPLMVIALTGSASLAGLSVGVFGLSRFVVSYPVGKITDTYGRKPGIFLGLVLALLGAVLVSQSMGLRSFTALVVGMLIFGMGMAAAYQMRVAVTDMFPPQLRAQALGYVSLGSLGGLVMGPLLVSLAEIVAPGLGREPLSLPWLLLPVLIVLGMLIVSFVRPDPKQIGSELDRHYPGFALPSRPPAVAGSDFSARKLIGRRATRLAIVSNCAAQANMSIVMVLTSLVLAHHGHSLSAIAFSHMFHTAGMFAFTIPLGRLADRLGRERVMYPGVAIALVGAGLVTFTGAFWSVTLGTFLVGLGWAAANVAATALIADQTTTAERGRAIGVNDSFAGGVTVITALVAGPLAEWAGLPAAGAAAVLFALVPLVMRAVDNGQ
jgi:MFS family permease